MIFIYLQSYLCSVQYSSVLQAIKIFDIKDAIVKCT